MAEKKRDDIGSTGSEAGTGKPWHAKVWITQPASGGAPARFDFPEQTTGAVSNPKTGICFSGGGTRSSTACLGQLRALSARDLLADVGYLSCVSGGSWAATAFTYNPSGTDEELLGPVVQPQDLTFEQLRSDEPSVMGTFGRTALSSGFDRGKALWEQSFEKDLLWYEVVGEFFFAPLGLFDPITGSKATEPKPQAYFAFDDANVKDIKGRNPALSGERFFTVRQAARGVSPRPFLIANATMMGPQGLTNLPSLYVGLEMTPLYCGAPGIFELKYPTSSPHVSEIVHLGGGFLETFAFGTAAPSQLPGRCRGPVTDDGACCVDLAPPQRHFGMVEASAMASAFYAQLLASYLNDTDFTMRRDLWPISSTAIPGGQQPLPTQQDYFIGDGGLLENFGIVSLLLRGVERIAVFVNTSTVLDTKYDGKTAPTASQIDTVISQLFGQALADGSNPYPLDHVFEHDAGSADGGSYDGFAEVVQGLVAAKNREQAGPGEWAGVVSANTLRTRANPSWALPGGRNVDVLWIYLDRVKEWESQLPTTADPDPAHSWGQPWTLQKYIEYGNGLGSDNTFGIHYEPVPYFPTYSLAYENDDVLPDFRLTPFQVNLMANLTWWVVDRNAEKLKKWFAG
ncbi:MAG: hypothetical protein DWQ36_09215 [Acidobacteria bacterium]|nr:MAG: hypothetical protein DWQ30_22460 [Acidobacteriota bacterium]REK08539.1 MAG: hypothetical protein DWQ36_09215 [Acidobacteriota bacterium]